MYRNIINDLNKWKNSSSRKPLILRGARQVGKTWILEEFGKSFTDGYVRINFDKEPKFAELFEGSKDACEIIEKLSFAFGRKITQNTLIIFDEVQACPDALNSLKYFCEDAPEFYVTSAGSLLGIALSSGFPVGKVDFLNVKPMDFLEFLYALKEKGLIEFIQKLNKIEKVPLILHDKLIEKLKLYYIIGGMPEAVKNWVKNQDVKECEKVINAILLSYKSDFAKHAPTKDVPKINLIWDSLPSQLARENKKFLYSAAKPGARAREYEDALNWLKNADLACKVSKITKPGLPISAYEDLTSFKIYMNDVGLLRLHSHLPSTVFVEKNKLFTEFKGSLTENYVLESLNEMFDTKLYYWSDATHEVDFIIQNEGEIYPIETKAERNIESPSIKNFLLKYPDTKFAIRLSLNNLSFDGKILNVPLYLTCVLKKVIGLASQQLQGGV